VAQLDSRHSASEGSFVVTRKSKDFNREDAKKSRKVREEIGIAHCSCRFNDKSSTGV